MKHKFFFTLIICILLLFFTAACGGKDNGPVLECPFTEIGWNASADDVIAAETGGADNGLAGTGEFSTYDSVYGGICYIFPKEYSGRQGTVKYMFDADEKLMCVAWAYGCGDEAELLSLYESINDSVNEKYGESGYAAEHPGNYGNVWYLETGDIVLTTMVTAENKALQYAYLHPAVSNRQPKAGNPAAS